MTPATRRIGSFALVALLSLFFAEALLRAGGWAYARWRLPARTAGQASAFRVLCLGDSFTFGIGAPKGSSYPEQLQALLDHDAPGRFQVINGGVPGSNSSQLLARLGPLLDESRSDLVLVLSGFNDSNLAESNYWKALTPQQMSWRRKAGFYAENFYTNCRLYKLIGALWALRPRPTRNQTQWDLYSVTPQAELPAAIERLRREADRNPDGFREWLRLGILYHKFKKFPEALAAYRKSVQLEPRSAEAHYQLAWMYHLLRDFDKAKAEVRIALRLDPEDPRALQLMGNYLDLGESALIPEEWLLPLLQYNFERIVSLVERHGSQIVLQTYPDSNGVNERLYAVFTVIAQTHLIAVADQSKVFGALKDGGRYSSGDEPDINASHPNALGYALMARQLLPLVRQAELRRRAASGAAAPGSPPKNVYHRSMDAGFETDSKPQESSAR